MLCFAASLCVAGWRRTDTLVAQVSAAPASAECLRRREELQGSDCLHYWKRRYLQKPQGLGDISQRVYSCACFF